MLYKYATAIQRGEDFVHPIIARNYFEADKLFTVRVNKLISVRLTEHALNNAVALEDVTDQSNDPCLAKVPGEWKHYWITEIDELQLNVNYVI